MVYFKVVSAIFLEGWETCAEEPPGQIFETRSFRIQSKSSVVQYRVTYEDWRIILKINHMKIAGGGVDAVR